MAWRRKGEWKYSSGIRHLGTVYSCYQLHVAAVLPPEKQRLEAGPEQVRTLWSRENILPLPQMQKVYLNVTYDLHETSIQPSVYMPQIDVYICRLRISTFEHYQHSKNTNNNNNYRYSFVTYQK
jgi:hypothetical protein